MCTAPRAVGLWILQRPALVDAGDEPNQSLADPKEPLVVGQGQGLPWDPRDFVCQIEPF